jgi:hypothetical protein
VRDRRRTAHAIDAGARTIMRPRAKRTKPIVMEFPPPAGGRLAIWQLIGGRMLRFDFDGIRARASARKAYTPYGMRLVFNVSASKRELI